MEQQLMLNISDIQLSESDKGGAKPTIVGVTSTGCCVVGIIDE